WSCATCSAWTAWPRRQRLPVRVPRARGAPGPCGGLQLRGPLPRGPLPFHGQGRGSRPPERAAAAPGVRPGTRLYLAPARPDPALPQALGDGRTLIAWDRWSGTYDGFNTGRRIDLRTLADRSADIALLCDIWQDPGALAE